MAPSNAGACCARAALSASSYIRHSLSTSSSIRTFREAIWCLWSVISKPTVSSVFLRMAISRETILVRALRAVVMSSMASPAGVRGSIRIGSSTPLGVTATTLNVRQCPKSCVVRLCYEATK